MTVVQYRPPRETGALDTGRSWVDLMGPAVELAKAIAGTEFVPRGMRGNAAAIAAAILYGDEVGLGPMQSLAKIAVIDGKPTLAAEAQRALILAAGHSIWPEEMTITSCTWAGRRADDDASARVTWTMDDARRANLAGKPNWRNYPRAMLSARASADLARAIFADVIGGLAATEEIADAGVELDEVVDVAADPLPAGTSSPRRRRRRTTATVSTPVADGPALPPADGEPGQPNASRPQLSRILGLYRARGLAGAESRQARLDDAGERLGRVLESSSNLSADEADELIAKLEAQAAADAGDPGPTEPEAGE